MKKNRIGKSAISRTLAGVCAAAAAVCSMAMPCAAAEEASGETYGKAGIVWMIKDYWDHRNTIELEPLDEFENNVISCTHTDVNITGNGQYEVILEGYHVVEDQIPFTEVGNLGVEFAVDFDKYPDISLTLDECTIDSVTYAFNEQPELEDSELGKVMKIKNAYGKNANTAPEMDAKPWTTTDPITVKFTVAGLDKDKLEDNPDEKIVTVYGNGSIDKDEDAAPAESETAVESQTDEESSAVESTAQEDSTASDNASSEADSSKAEDGEKASDNWIIYACIAGGVVVVIIVIAVIAKKKS